MFVFSLKTWTTRCQTNPWGVIHQLVVNTVLKKLWRIWENIWYKYNNVTFKFLMPSLLHLLISKDKHHGLSNHWILIQLDDLLNLCWFSWAVSEKLSNTWPVGEKRELEEDSTGNKVSRVYARGYKNRKASLTTGTSWPVQNRACPAINPFTCLL